MATRKSISRKIDYYGEGAALGHARALNWLANPKRGNPAVGGTLQYQILELAERFSAATNQDDRDRAKGEIVGFSYAIECPASAAACREAAMRRQALKKVAA